MTDRDPIVEETRAAGRALEEGAPGDVHAFFERLRRAEERYRDRIVGEGSVGIASPTDPAKHGTVYPA